MEPATQSTISEPLYKVLCDNKCLEYEEFVESYLKSMQIVECDYDGNLRSYLNYRDYLKDLLSALKDFTVPTFSFRANDAIRNYYNNKFLEYEDIKVEYQRKEQALRDKFEKDWEESCEDEKQRVQDAITPLTKKHHRLLAYKDKLKVAMERYGISPSDVKISDDITKEDFEKLLDASLAVCKEFDKKENSFLDLALSPLEDDNAVVIVYVVFVIVVCRIALPLVALAYFYKMIRGTKTMYGNIENLRVASSLMYDISMERFLPESDRYVEPVKNTTELDKEIEALHEELQAQDPTTLLEEELKAYTTDAGLQYVSSRIEEEINKVRKTVADRIARVEELLAVADKICEAEAVKIKRLGDYSNPSAVLNTNMVIGYVNDTIPVMKDLGLTNINFVGTYNNDTIDNMKVLWLNMFLNVRANLLETYIVDTEYLGQKFSEFINETTKSLIHIVNKDVQKALESAQKKYAEGILKLKTSTILEYNKNAEELGMLPHPYYLYIILTGLDDKFTENKAFMEFLTYSASAGIFVWTIYPQKLKGCLNINKTLELDEEGEKIHYDFDLGAKAMDTFEYAVENNKIKALDYRSMYLDKYLPKDRWWKSDSIKGVNIRMGLQNGDPAKPTLLYFDDKNVHFLLGGATGAGKSVAIDCAMQSMVHEYPTDELQLVYIDLKNAEVKKYVKDGICTIPHCLIAAGTTDGEYCLSIFKWAYEEMKRRITICGKYNQQKVEGLRKKFDDPTRDDYNPEVHLPRVVIIIDEFQVMFNTTVVPQRIINEIIGIITSLVKLARAASMHLWFNSQEMSGTLPKNVLDNFSTRGALRCTEEVSSQLLGNPAAGTIKEKVGWMYTNESAGQDPNANKLWKIPFAPTDDLLLGMDELCEKAVAEGKPKYDARFYDEKQGRNEDDLKAAYEEFPQLAHPYFFVMGERTIYSTKPTPMNFRVMQDDRENIFIMARERQDAMDLIGTMLHNIEYKNGQASMLINCADKDTAYLLDLEKYMPEGWEDFLNSKSDTAEILDDMDEVADLREEAGVTENPLYVLLLMWEKRDGIGINENYRLTDRMEGIIRRYNELNIHVIFVSRDKGIPNNLIGMCNHRIVAKTDGNTAFKLIDDSRPENFPTVNGDESTFAIYKVGSDAQKFKIYRHRLARELEEREL